MITPWMLYALAISVIVAGVAAALAVLLRRWGRPERFVWAGGMVAAVALPFLAPLWRAWRSAGAPPEAVSGVAGTGALGLPTFIGLPGSPLLVSAGPYVVLAWAAVSLALLSRAAVRGVRLVRELRAADAFGSGHPALISRTSTLGPGVTGLRRPRILLPQWLSSLPRDQRSWIVRHEVEHLRAGDLWLHHAALVVRMILPWNLATTFLSLRLQRALETDCDRRVLRGRSDGLRSYAETLISVAGIRPRAALALGTFNDRLTSLEHRIRTMTRPSRPWNPFRTSLAGLLVPAGLLVACEMPSPTGIQPPRGPQPVEAPPAADTPETRDAADGPTFTPYTVAPDILNREEVIRALQEAYPAELRDNGVSGTANVWFFIGEDGKTRDLRIQQSSGIPELDQAALTVAGVMEFSPARNRDTPVPVWVAFPITFQIR